MTTRIHSLLLALKAKFETLHNELQVQRAENEKLTTDLKQANVLMSEREELVFNLEQENNRLKSQLDALLQEKEKHQNQLVSAKNEEIDGLVREIENCIDLLKQ